MCFLCYICINNMITLQYQSTEHDHHKKLGKELTAEDEHSFLRR